MRCGWGGILVLLIAGVERGRGRERERGCVCVWVLVDGWGVGGRVEGYGREKWGEREGRRGGGELMYIYIYAVTVYYNLFLEKKNAINERENAMNERESLWRYLSSSIYIVLLFLRVWVWVLDFDREREYMM